METELNGISLVRDAAIIDYRALNPYYITGLCEGESSFTYLRNGKVISLRFGIKLNESDKNLVFALQGFFGVGNVYYSGPREPGIRSGATGASWYYCVSSIAGIGTIVKHFDQYRLVGKKADNFYFWRKMYEIKLAGGHGSEEILKSMAEKLSTMSTKGARYLKINRWSK